MIWQLFHWIGSIIRKQFIRHVIFTGDYSDVLTQRREWVKQRRVILLDLRVKKQKIGKKKFVSLILFYCEDSEFTKILGFKKGLVHQSLMNH